ncbi:hypothetical protein ACLOJK_011082 [Asimina triloba]
MALKLTFQGRPFSSSTTADPSRIRVCSVKCSVSFSSHGASPGLGERPWKTADARLVLEDGSIWKAKSFGASGTQVGEVVFNTSLTGITPVLPSRISNQKFKYIVYDVDTRAITRRLRQDGSLIGVLSTEESKSDEELLEMSCTWDIVGVDLISGVSCDAPYEWVDKTNSAWEFSESRPRDAKFHVVAYDFGIKHNILRRLASYGCKVTVVPSTWPATETLKMKPDGVLFSNGPGDPSAVPYAVETVKEIIGKVPVFGICMGHQLLGQALGGKTFKMKFGHHGGNHPVRNLRNNIIEISAQNHNYAVDPASLPAGVEVTHINLNDGSCAGLAFPELDIMSLQYHPEASPGPHDSDPAFREFMQLMERSKVKERATHFEKMLPHAILYYALGAESFIRATSRKANCSLSSDFLFPPVTSSS